MRVPGWSGGKDVEEVVGLVDVMPTVLSLLGIEVPPHVEGIDLSPHLRGEPTPERYVYCESVTPTKLGCNPLLAVVGDRWKYIHTTRPELYDLREDPRETRDLASERPDQVKRLRGELERILERARRAEGEPAAVELDEPELAGLRALGYLGAAADDGLEVDTERDDPKDFIGVFIDLGAGIYAKTQGNYEEARVHLRRALKRKPEMADVYRLLGQIALMEGKAAEAVSHFRLYLALVSTAEGPGSTFGERQVSPDQIAETHSDLGVAFGLLGRYGDAEAAIREGIRVRPDLATSHFNLGYAMLKQGRRDDAIRHFHDALEIDPDHERSRQELDLLESSP
jgi:tetratricopeptide (TPR) repeat protein